jgi:hypothetical protein
LPGKLRRVQEGLTDMCNSRRATTRICANLRNLRISQ